MITVILLTILTSITILYIHNIAFIIILAYLWYLNIQNEKTYRLKKKIYENMVENMREENKCRKNSLKIIEKY